MVDLDHAAKWQESQETLMVPILFVELIIVGQLA